MEEINAKRLKRQSMTAGPFSVIAQETFREFHETNDERKEAKVICMEEDLKRCAAFTRNERNLQNFESADEELSTNKLNRTISVTPREDEFGIITKKEVDKKSKDTASNIFSSSQNSGQPNFPSSPKCGKKEQQNLSEVGNCMQGEAEFIEAQFQKASNTVSTEMKGDDTVAADNSDFKKPLHLQSLEKCSSLKRNVSQKNQQQSVSECRLPSALDIDEEKFDLKRISSEMPETDASHSDKDSTSENTASLTDEGICVSRDVVEY